MKIKIITLILLAVGISFFAFSSPHRHFDKIYLLGEGHGDPEDEILFKELLTKSQEGRLRLGIELSQNLDPKSGICISRGICDSKENTSDFLFGLENPIARQAALLLYLYNGLDYLLFFENQKPSEKNLTTQELDQSWNSYFLRILLTFLREVRCERASWARWLNTKKGVLCERITTAVSPTSNIPFEEEGIIKPLPDLETYLQLYQSYDTQVASSFREEVVEILPQYLLPLYLEGDLKDILRNFEKIKSKNHLQFFNHVELVLLRTRDFLIAINIVEQHKKSKMLGVPTVIVCGMRHVPGVYMFLKNNGMSVEVGLSENNLKLSQAMAERSKSKTLEYIFEAMGKAYGKKWGADIEQFFSKAQKTNKEL
jgi:hypothetical protein